LEITLGSQELPRPPAVVITTKEQREESQKVNSPSTVAFRRAKGSNVCPNRERYFRGAIGDYRTILFSFVAIFTLLCGQSQASENKPPNIVLIFVDDLGWQETGFSGSDFLETPRLDQLAGEGMVFRHAYASAGNCQPSRACMLSGQYTARHGVYAVGSTDRGPKSLMRMTPVPNRANLPLETVTLGESLQAAGYATGFFGKCHMNSSNTGKSEHAGFDVIAHSQHGLNSDDPADPKAIFSISKAACEFIEANRQRPFFAYIPHYAVHSRLEGRAETLTRFKDKSPGKLGQNHTLLAGCLWDMDAGIGMVLDKLKSLGLKEDTLVVFTSDNGGPHVTNEPLRGAKGGYYEGGIRVPMIVRWPGVVAAGSSCDTPVSNVDFYPTFLAASGAAAPASPLDGESLLPLLKAEGSLNRQSLFWHFPGYLDKPVLRGRDSVFRTRPVSVIRKGDLKLHLYHEEWQLDGGREKLASNRAVELYDLAADPGEHHDVAAIRTKQRDELLDELLVWMTQTQAVLPQNVNPAYDPPAFGKDGNKKGKGK
jgi:arylsulfatase A-like enzyme